MRKIIYSIILLCVLVGCTIQEPVEEVTEPTVEEILEPQLTIEQARELAQGTECTEKGTLIDNYMFNENSKTWWIDLEMKPEFENELCSPACVVFEETNEVEINWRCTGALP